MGPLNIIWVCAPIWCFHFGQFKLPSKLALNDAVKTKGWLNRLPEVWGNFTSSVQYWKNWNTSSSTCAMCYSCVATQLILFFITSGTLKSVQPSTSTPASFFSRHHSDINTTEMSSRKCFLTESLQYQRNINLKQTKQWRPAGLHHHGFAFRKNQLWIRVVGSVFFIFFTF